jgi:hypothetical protein
MEESYRLWHRPFRPRSPKIAWLKLEQPTSESDSHCSAAKQSTGPAKSVQVLTPPPRDGISSEPHSLGNFREPSVLVECESYQRAHPRFLAIEDSGCL